MQTRNLIIGTAGHIDHGKSSLVRALTGTDPDRLPQEKQRGITIALGFAELVLPSGRRAGLVDVPGHERFVRQMVAGATGVDLALIVIAADDGVMPQTTEHIAVLELLGVKSAVVALTKVDLVDSDWAAFIKEEIQNRLQCSQFAQAPIIEVSTKTGRGLDELKIAIDSVLDVCTPVRQIDAVRMPIDRVFSIKGAGTVVTGTLWGGHVKVGDELCIIPGARKTRVRSIQMHGTATDAALAGNRVALCLTDLAVNDISVGDFAVDATCKDTTDRFDAKITYTDPFDTGKPLKTGTKVHIAHGTKEVMGRILLMDGTPEIAPKQSSLAQVRLDEHIAAQYGDKFVVRSYSPAHVIAGGTILTPHPRRRTNLDEADAKLLNALDAGRMADAVAAVLEAAKTPLSASEIAKLSGVNFSEVQRALNALTTTAAVQKIGDSQAFYIRPSLLNSLIAKIEKTTLEFHAANADAAGIAKETLRQKTGAADPQIFDAILIQAIARKNITSEGGVVSHAGCRGASRQKELAAANKILCALCEAGDMPPDMPDVLQRLHISNDLAKQAISRLIQDGKIIRINTTRYYDANVINSYIDSVKAKIQTDGPQTAANLKEAMNTSRKYAMPILEYLDSKGITKRQGDLRDLI